MKIIYNNTINNYIHEQSVSIRQNIKTSSEKMVQLLYIYV